MQKITVFVIAESSTSNKGRVVPLAPQVKSAPHYFAQSVPSQHILGKEKKKFGGENLEITIKTYHPYAIVATTTIEIDDIFKEETLKIKDDLIDICFEFIEKYGGNKNLSEECAVYQISDYKGDPELILDQYAGRIAALLKSEKLELDDKEVEHTLSHQFKYAKDEIMVIDWDGAFLFDPIGEFGQALELLELANYQLLRYRILDLNLDENFSSAYKLIQQESSGMFSRWFRIQKVNQAFKDVIKIRAQSIADFDAVERDIKLIGDWYSARVFELLAKKFRLENWRRTIKEKLESLEDVYSIVSENLGVSRMQTLELIQTGGWFILQIGWFVLIILEFVYFTR